MGLLWRLWRFMVSVLAVQAASTSTFNRSSITQSNEMYLPNCNFTNEPSKRFIAFGTDQLATTRNSLISVNHDETKHEILEEAAGRERYRAFLSFYQKQLSDPEIMFEQHQQYAQHARELLAKAQQTNAISLEELNKSIFTGDDGKKYTFFQMVFNEYISAIKFTRAIETSKDGSTAPIIFTADAGLAYDLSQLLLMLGIDPDAGLSEGTSYEAALQALTLAKRAIGKHSTKDIIEQFEALEKMIERLPGKKMIDPLKSSNLFLMDNGLSKALKFSAGIFSLGGGIFYLHRRYRFKKHNAVQALNRFVLPSDARKKQKRMIESKHKPPSSPSISTKSNLSSEAIEKLRLISDRTNELKSVVEQIRNNTDNFRERLMSSASRKAAISLDALESVFLSLDLQLDQLPNASSEIFEEAVQRTLKKYFDVMNAALKIYDEARYSRYREACDDAQLSICLTEMVQIIKSLDGELPHTLNGHRKKFVHYFQSDAKFDKCLEDLKRKHPVITKKSVQRTRKKQSAKLRDGIIQHLNEPKIKMIKKNWVEDEVKKNVEVAQKLKGYPTLTFDSERRLSQRRDEEKSTDNGTDHIVLIGELYKILGNHFLNPQELHEEYRKFILQFNPTWYTLSAYQAEILSKMQQSCELKPLNLSIITQHIRFLADIACQIPNIDHKGGFIVQAQQIMTSQIRTLDIRDIVNLLTALAKIGITWPSLDRAFHRALMDRLNEISKKDFTSILTGVPKKLTSKHAAQLLWAFAVMSIHDESAIKLGSVECRCLQKLANQCSIDTKEIDDAYCQQLCQARALMPWLNLPEDVNMILERYQPPNQRSVFEIQVLLTLSSMLSCKISEPVFDVQLKRWSDGRMILADDSEIIIEIDGPDHFIRDNHGKYQKSVRTNTRDILYERKKASVIVITCFDWSELNQNQTAWFNFINTRLKAMGKMPLMPKEAVYRSAAMARLSSGYHQHSFFTQDSNDDSAVEYDIRMQKTYGIALT